MPRNYVRKGRKYKKVIRQAVTDGSEVPYDTSQIAADANFCDKDTMKRWLRDGKPHYGYTYRYA